MRLHRGIRTLTRKPSIVTPLTETTNLPLRMPSAPSIPVPLTP